MMGRTREDPRGGWRVLGIALTAALLSPTLACGLPMLWNRGRLWMLEREVRAARHPPGARVIAVASSYGLMGNGNHCDFVVDLTMEAPLPPAALPRAYERVHVPFDGDSLHLQVQGTPTEENGRTRYVVGVFTQTEAGFDVNCR